jgi:tight adherence protein B
VDTVYTLVFMVLVFGAVFLVGQVLTVPAFGTSQSEIKRLKQRLATLDEEDIAEVPVSMLRERFRRKASGLEKSLRWIPGIEHLAERFNQHHGSDLGYAYIFASFVLALLGAIAGWGLSGKLWVTLGASLGMGWLPSLNFRRHQQRRFELFEEQLPDALEAMTRALLAGHPFSATLNLVAKDMADPIATEFRIAFDEINAGIEIRAALRNMLNRVPSMTLLAVTTTVVLQRETGGNLAETLKKISGIIRGRFTFQSRVRALTAEARMSAWILALMPFGMFGIMYFVSPKQIQAFLHDPEGQSLIWISLGLIVAGVLWLRHMLRLEI